MQGVHLFCGVCWGHDSVHSTWQTIGRVRGIVQAVLSEAFIGVFNRGTGMERTDCSAARVAVSSWSHSAPSA